MRSNVVTVQAGLAKAHSIYGILGTSAHTGGIVNANVIPTAAKANPEVNQSWKL